MPEALHPGLYARRSKRVMDVMLASALLLLLGPLLLGIAVLVLLVEGRPVLFRQDRPGLHGEPFRLLKFRTMCPGSADPRTDGERLTSLGRFLRTTSLDELPELWNVLSGDMSFVGPRPLLLRYLDRYTPTQARRHDVRPGITGWAQVNGRNKLTWEEKFSLDLWYIERLSLRLDLEILSKTLGQVLMRKHISATGEATMPEFLGTIDKGRHS